MFTKKFNILRTALLALIAVSAFGMPTYSGELAFNRLPGRWVGDGWLQMSSGDREKIKCIATYFVKNGGTTLKQNLRCASTSYTVISRGALSSRGGKISGTWNEETFEISGNVTGTATAGRMTLVVKGDNFTADFSVTTRGARQSVIMSSTGTNIKKMEINLHKG